VRPISRLVFELQNMHFDSMGNFRWNVREFQPKLEKILAEAREEGRMAGRRELAEEVGRNLVPPQPQKVV
jgi:hypothetical protein